MNFINFTKLKNPVYSYNDWSIKDACMVYHNGEFFLFYSAFYRDKIKTISHVVEVSTKDWVTFSEPIFNINGKEEGWKGLCSPNITQIGNRFMLTFNSWGDHHKNGRTNNLFYIESTDLRNWSEMKQIAKNLTENLRCIDIAISYTNKKYYAIWKERSKGVGDRPRIAISESLDDDFKFIGKGICNFFTNDGKPSEKTNENFQFIQIDDLWYIITTDYKPHTPMIYKISGDGLGKYDEDWLKWINGFELKIPIEDFNTNHIANSPFMSDWRNYDGYFYLLYAGRTEGNSHARRGNNKLGLARVKVIHKEFQIPGNV
jgi:predicted GH43/DUF377 family glycosyl hydrolase